MSAMAFRGRNVTPHTLVNDLQPGDVRHGLSDGSWSLIDLLAAIITYTGPDSTIDLAVWTASGDHGQRLRDLTASGRTRGIRLLVDRSFITRQPKACNLIRSLFGDGAVRVWSCHAKWAVVKSRRLDVLVMFSANLNRNPRIENFTLWADRSMVAHYSAMVEDLWGRQGDGQPFGEPRIARHHTADILGDSTGDDLLTVRIDHDDVYSYPLWVTPDLMSAIRKTERLAMGRLRDDADDVVNAEIFVTAWMERHGTGNPDQRHAQALAWIRECVRFPATP